MNKEYFIKKPAKTIITLTDDNLSIKRKGFMNLSAHGLKGEKSIFLKNITSIQLKKPGMMTGYIQFSYPGSDENKGGVFDATTDENTVVFWKKHYNEMLELKSHIEKIINTPTNIPPSQNEEKQDNLDKLKKLKELLDIEAITKEEYEIKKREFLK